MTTHNHLGMGRGTSATTPPQPAQIPDQLAPRLDPSSTLSPDELARERWLPVPGYADRYEVSDMGRVRSLPLGEIHLKSGLVVKHEGGLIAPRYEKKGYTRFTAHRSGKREGFYLQRLVAKVFLPNPLNLPAVKHLDGNPRNNRLTNLAWSDFDLNNLHSGMEVAFIKSLPLETIQQIIRAYQCRKEQRETTGTLGERFGLHPTTVWRIARNNGKHALSLHAQSPYSHD